MDSRSLVFGSALVLGLLIFTLVCVGLSGQSVIAQTAGLKWHVDRNCTVCGAGTIDSPFQTINQALIAASDNDTILISQGIYVEHLFINTSVALMGGYAVVSPTWTRDITHYETVVTSNGIGDWNGDWLGSASVVRDGSTYRMWYSAGGVLDGESIGYANSPDGVNWFRPLNNPLLRAGPSGTWDQAGIANPVVLTTDNGFQMWYVGKNAMGEMAIGHATSSDGLTWQKHDGNPILRPDTVDDTSFGFPTVVQDGPNDYKMWYSGARGIWLATSSDGQHWIKQLSTPVLVQGSPGAWDDDQVYAAYVIAGSDKYEMWYVGEGTTITEPRIGYAESDDGLNWTKSPDNPVLGNTMDTWEEGGITYPAVIKTGATGYTMWYRGETSGRHAFGLATSGDGVAWEKYSGNPVMAGGEPTQWSNQVIYFRENSTGAVLDGLTISGGAAEYGGGIRIYGSSPIIRNCTVTGNAARNGGGGIHLMNGAPLIENTVVSGNVSQASWAGGMYIGNASPTISASLVTSNVARTDGGGLIIWSTSQPTLIATTVTSNIASGGGGVKLGSDSTFYVYDSRIDGNLARQIAGVWVQDSTLAMTNTFVVDNHAFAGGPGAVGFSRSSGKLVNITIAGNSASEGPGGIAFITDQPDRSLIILNSILAFNGIDDLSCYGGTCVVTYSDVQEGIVGSGNISADPRFVDRAGGDYHLRSNSPVIDSGTSEGAPATDFEGDPRPAGGVDMGADEFAGDLIDIFLSLVLRDFS